MVSRRQFLAGLGAASVAVGLPAGALAARSRDNRLVVIILRGGMDGLDMVAPVGDSQLLTLRPRLARTPNEAAGYLPLTDFFGLHPAMERVAPMIKQGELGFVHAVATPYRSRSHFDGQDALENGTGNPVSSRGGWLNRMVTVLAPDSETFAANVGRTTLPILSGPTRVAGWSPDSHLAISESGTDRLRRLYAGDPLFEKALEGALKAQQIMGDENERNPANGASLARMTARFLKPADGARIAAFSLGGWDTHGQQTTALRRPMWGLAEALTVLRDELGDAWRHTVVLAMTEFGRTAAENGTLGTDHGTGSVLIYAGGAVNGGRVLGRWPGLTPDRLYKERDLMPTDDTRRLAAWVLKARFGLSESALSRDIFPGLALGADPKLV